MLFAHKGNHRLVAAVMVSLCALAANAPAVAQLACSYEISHVIQAPAIPPGDSPDTTATAISPSGRYVCGYISIPGGSTRAFAYDAQSRQFMVLPLPTGGVSSMAWDVNDAGLAVGSYWVTGGIAPQRGFVYSISAAQYIAELMPYPGASWCVANAINSKNEVCGFRSIGSKGDTMNPKTAFRWSTESGFEDDLGLIDGHNTFGVDIAEDGAIAVEVELGTPPHIWQGKQLVNVGGLKGAAGSFLGAIRAADHAVGNSQFIVQGQPFWNTAFEFHNGSVRALPALDAVNESCMALAIGEGGVIFGGCGPNGGQGTWKPCAWVSGEIIALNDLLAPVPGISVRLVLDASLTGRVVCDAFGPTGYVSVILDPAAGSTGDTNCDASVNLDDLIAVILDWGKTDSPADVNHDQIVDVVDLSIVIEHWTLN
jgi:uncharacterized membrane protein